MGLLNELYKGVLSDRGPQGILAQGATPQPQGLLGILGRNPLMPPAQPRTIADEAYERYPRLKGYGFQFIDSRGDPAGQHRKLETYPADERDNPRPGKPTIQQFDPSMTYRDFLGETLHILPKVDPVVGQLKQQFVQSMTPEQQQRLRGQYEYHRKNFGEQRPFDQWAEMTGLDSWFRGQITGQWPSEMYTPQQLQMFRALQEYLSR